MGLWGLGTGFVFVRYGLRAGCVPTLGRLSTPDTPTLEALHACLASLLCEMHMSVCAQVSMRPASAVQLFCLFDTHIPYSLCPSLQGRLPAAIAAACGGPPKSGPAFP